MKWINTQSNTDVTKRLPIYSWANTIEDAAMDQYRNLSRLPIVWKHIGAMADSHCGFGMPIGGVVACNDAVIPNGVGKDGGCGVIVMCLNTHIKIFTKKALERIRERIVKKIPLGFNKHKDPQKWDGFYAFLNAGLSNEWLDDRAASNAFRSLGTLGGGKRLLPGQEGNLNILKSFLIDLEIWRQMTGAN